MPGDRPIGLYDGQTSINTFPLLFRDYFGLDYELLPDRVFASRKYDLPYDQIEITDRLPPSPPSPQRRRSRNRTRRLSSIGRSATISNRPAAAARNPSSV